MDYNPDKLTSLTTTLLRWAESQGIQVVIDVQDGDCRNYYRKQGGETLVHLSWSAIVQTAGKACYENVSPYKLMGITLSHELGHYITGLDELAAWEAAEQLIQSLGLKLPGLFHPHKWNCLGTYGLVNRGGRLVLTKKGQVRAATYFPITQHEVEWA